MDRLGVDIGGVIIDRVNDGLDTSFFGDNYLLTTPSPGVFESLKTIVEKKFGSQVWLVSKCGPKIQSRTKEWLKYNDFYERTGIAVDHVRFTPTRIGKAAIAGKLGLTHFVDDRLEVLGYMPAKVEHLYLYGDSPSLTEENFFLQTRVQQADNWEEMQKLILES